MTTTWPQLLFRTANTVAQYYGCLLYYTLGGGFSSKPYGVESCPYFRPVESDSEAQRQFKKYARIHCYSLAAVFYLWDKPHYRKGSYREDLADNLRNVAIPGTGIPLNWVVVNKLVAILFLVLVVPKVCFIAAFHYWYKDNLTLEEFGDEFAVRLLAPDDWFSYWRLNCRLAALHSYLHNNPAGYEMENKWTFLEEGDKRGVPVSPFLSTSGIVVKHRNEEGGMGIFFYKNATSGGDWIIQERIENSEWVSSLLPEKAPLSTFRVITQSRASIDWTEGKEAKLDEIDALSCVFRAGRAGAATDHDSILFDIDPKTGVLLKGTTNAHWYRLGLHEALPGMCPWRSTHHATHHPDGDILVEGNQVPDFKNILTLVETSHMKLCPDVPLVGWDVVLSADKTLPVCLLEVNLSCNFFRGSFDKGLYLDFMDDSFRALHRKMINRECADDDKKTN
mmetsp:Transcript_19671/g.30241  ORF Transcript_19671/g.30241 Transcript_19671/m.30241 type:complete len:450 (-) Transcript_19671:112-1461(-)|eukprot:CAMPEP_0196807190 /NCGR_PEP_ID=MMETSP1362-20130617/7144_1 /TAXON_ID=163516 /ORGANISM="Leptocylindrus danicus, Strain CCMP1856" /LENGTH=449 /DNA_ID=CAMNT_0042180997 /DNA_START=144 /DNA_END=1493 /DNA_ORIENTATION=-